MFEKYSYKKKCLALCVVFFMLLITAYKRSFSMLFEVIKENKTLSKTTEEFDKKSNNFDMLSKEIALLDKTIGEEGVSKEKVQQSIVSFISENHSQVSISDLQPIHVFSDENYTITTNQLDVTGGANQLLKLGYDFEKQFKLSRIVSMNFYTAKNNKSEILHLKIIFQNYENNK